jgi:hypothetical protein
MRSGRKKRGHSATSRLRERANLSFCIVVIFFAVFSIIVLTEIFFIDERPGPAPIGAHRSPEYEEIVLSDDYLQLYKGPDNEAASHLAGRLLAPAAPINVLRPEEPLAPPLQDAGFVKFSNLTAYDAKWQSVRGTRYIYLQYRYFDLFTWFALTNGTLNHIKLMSQCRQINAMFFFNHFTWKIRVEMDQKDYFT